MSDLPPDMAAAIETAWERSDGYEFDWRRLTFSRSHFVMAEKIGLNMNAAIVSGRAVIEDKKGEVQIHYDGFLEDVGIILYVASLDRDGLRKARRNPDIAKDAACEVFDDWNIPLSGPRFDAAVSVAMEILADIRASDSRPQHDDDEGGVEYDGGK